jgi:putative redox protein
MKHEIETQWMGKMQFNALVNGHTIVMDAPERVGGEDNGPIPKPFVLTALSGCTGMEVIGLLRKAGKQVTSFDLKVEGEISKQPPIEYTSIHIIYDLQGDALIDQDVLAAVTASQERYCGVSSMLKKIMPVTWELTYNNRLMFTNKQTEILAA